MTVSTPVPGYSPLMLAWEAHKATDDYANSRNWAAYSDHREGSLWALFVAGWQAALASRDAEIAQLREDAERYACAKTLEGEVVVMETFKNLGASYLDEALDELIAENAAIDAQRKP